MNIEGNPVVTGWRRVSVAVFIVMLLSMVDACVMTWSESKNHFKVVAGKNEDISGKLANPIDPRLLQATFAREGNTIPEDLLDKVITYEPAGKGFRILFKSVEGRLWRGKLITDPGAVEGVFPVRIYKVGEKPGEHTPQFLIQVFNDETGYRRSYWSIAKRFLGIEPWWITIGSIPLALLCVYLVMRQTTREDEEMQSRGIGPIYKLSKQKNGWEIVFGLGSDHGVKPGDRMIVVSREGRTLGHFEADDVKTESSSAKLGLDVNIDPNCLISRSM